MTVFQIRYDSRYGFEEAKWLPPIPPYGKIGLLLHDEAAVRVLLRCSCFARPVHASFATQT